MPRTRCLTGLVTALISALGAWACAPIPPSTGTTTQASFQSAITGETFDVLVRVPPGYEADPGRAYPVVYQLDATFLDEFARSAGSISQLELAGRVPPTIVVGVGHRSDGDPTHGRVHDFVPADPASPALSGRADEFFRFLRDELAPDVEARFRVDRTAGRTLVGHSLGGLFALYAFFRAEPDGTFWFRNVLAADPSYGENDGIIYGLEAESAARDRRRPGRLYLTASFYTGGIQRFSHEEMTARIRRDFDPSVLALESNFEETDHGGLLQRSMDHGLPFVLTGAL